MGHRSLIKNKTQTAVINILNLFIFIMTWRFVCALHTVCRANCWDCNGFYIGKTKRRLHDRKTEHFKALAKNDNTSAIADHVKATGHNIKWDHFDILAKGKTDYHCKIKETFFIQELEPAFNVNVGSEKLMLY